MIRVTARTALKIKECASPPSLRTCPDYSAPTLGCSCSPACLDANDTEILAIWLESDYENSFLLLIIFCFAYFVLIPCHVKFQRFGVF
jgi:hypothetical protein